MLNTPLSKSALQDGAQCPRKLWFRCYCRNMRDEDEYEGDEPPQIRIGNIVGEAAQHFFENDGRRTVVIDTEEYGFNPSAYEYYAQQTADYMSDPEISTIAEAAFYTGDFIVFVDLLHRNEEGSWDIYEVKATKVIGPVHVLDASWQTYIIRELCGVDIRTTFLLHPSSGYWKIENGIYDDIQDVFEVVDNYTPYIDNISGGDEPMWIEGSWMNGHGIAECIEAIVEMLSEEQPPACSCIPGEGICCHGNIWYPCNYISCCQHYLSQGM